MGVNKFLQQAAKEQNELIEKEKNKPESIEDSSSDGSSTPASDIDIDSDGSGTPSGDIDIDSDGNGTPASDIDIDSDGSGTPSGDIDIDSNGTLSGDGSSGTSRKNGKKTGKRNKNVNKKPTSMKQRAIYMTDEEYLNLRIAKTFTGCESVSEFLVHLLDQYVEKMRKNPEYELFEKTLKKIEMK